MYKENILSKPSKSNHQTAFKLVKIRKKIEPLHSWKSKPSDIVRPNAFQKVNKCVKSLNKATENDVDSGDSSIEVSCIPHFIIEEPKYTVNNFPPIRRYSRFSRRKTPTANFSSFNKPRTNHKNDLLHLSIIEIQNSIFFQILKEYFFGFRYLESRTKYLFKFNI